MKIWNVALAIWVEIELNKYNYFNLSFIFIKQNN